MLHERGISNENTNKFFSEPESHSNPPASRETIDAKQEQQSDEELRQELKSKYGYKLVGPFSKEGLAQARDAYLDSFFIDRTGKRIGDYYGWVSNFENGRAWVSPHEDRFDLIDTEGRQLNRDTIVEYSDFSEGIARVKGSDGKYFFINEQGKRISNERYEDADEFVNSQARVKKDGNWYRIDKSGQKKS